MHRLLILVTINMLSIVPILEACKNKSAMANLITTAPADHRSVVHFSPEVIPQFQELWEQLPPVVTKGPGKDLILVILFIFLHVISQVPVSGEWRKTD